MTALARSMTDRARAIRTREQHVFIEGEPGTDTETGRWFPARLRIEASREGNEPLPRRALFASLTFPASYDADVDAADRVEVESEAYGGISEWEVDGPPLGLVRGRRVVARRARLRMIEP